LLETRPALRLVQAAEPALFQVHILRYAFQNTAPRVSASDDRSSTRTSHPAHLRRTRLTLRLLVGFWPGAIQLIGLALGSVCTLGAAAVGIWGISYWISTGDFPGPLLAGGAVIAVLGVQGYILALVGEYLSRIQRDTEDRPLYWIDQDLSTIDHDRG
jgi:hypothetical protein